MEKRIFDGVVRIDLKRILREGTKLNRDLKRALEIAHKEKLELLSMAGCLARKGGGGNFRC